MLGIIVALWADGFEQLQMLNTFVITPLTYLGGIFYSITMLPANVVLLTKLNPFFYFADGFRRSMVGVGEADLMAGVVISLVLLVGLFTLVIGLFKRGWKIRS